MTKLELRELLIEENISNLVYCLNGGMPNECYILNYNDSNWETYYSERGRKVDLQIFKTESQACEYFYKWLMKTFK